jgi:hypothetical protein
MKVSDAPFLSHSDDPHWDDFPCSIRFNPESNTFTMNYSVYCSYDGNDYYAYRGTYYDDEEKQTIMFYIAESYEDGMWGMLEKPKTHTTHYTFTGNTVELESNPWDAIFTKKTGMSITYYYKGFVVHTPYSSDSDSA